MRTGFDLLQGDLDSGLDPTFLRKIHAALQLLMEESLRTALRFAYTCGRTDVTHVDMVAALRYEAHEFFDKPDLETRFLQIMEEDEGEEGEEDEDTSGNDTDGNDTDDNHSPPSPGDPHPNTCYVQGDKTFHDLVRSHSQNWSDWQPDDPLQQILKRSVDKAELVHGRVTI